MASDPELISFASREQMAERVADLLEFAAVRAVAEKGVAEFALSGGSTPIAAYKAFAAREIDWTRTRVTLVDERWVPPSHPRSNETAVRQALAAASGVQIEGLYTGAATPADALRHDARFAEAQMINSNAVILGMGDDGHTASWFPHAEGLEAALSGDVRFAAIRATRSAVTGEEVDRLTLTLQAIRNGRLIILMLAGKEKRATFERALQSGPAEDMPVRAILRARPDLWVCWAP